MCISLLTLSTGVWAILTHSQAHISGSSDALFVYELEGSVNVWASHDPKNPRAPHPHTVTTRHSQSCIHNTESC